MAKYLYEVKLQEGSSNKNYPIFLDNVDQMGAVPTDYGSNRSLCVISTSANARALHQNCTIGFPWGELDEVTVTEITKTTLNDSDNPHSAYWNVLVRFASASKDYPNLKGCFKKP